MAQVVRLTEGVSKATAAGDEQPLYSAVDVSGFDALDLLITGGFETPGSPILTLSLISGNQVSTTDGWVAISIAPAFRGSPAAAIGCWSITGGFFRYVRWKVAGLSGATAARFIIEGVGRRNSR